MITSRSSLPIPAPETRYTVPLLPSDEESAAPGISVAQIMCVVRAYAWHSLVTALAMVCLSYGVIKLLPKSYVATATLIVAYDNKDPLANRESLAGEYNTYIPTQIELILSRVVLQPVTDTLKLASDPEFTGGYVGTPAVLNEVVTRNLHDSLTVTPGVNSQLLYISAAAKNPDRAAEIANAVADEYLRREKLRTNAPAGERAERYAKQLGELRGKAATAQDALTAFRQQHGLTDIETDRGDAEGATLAELQVKLNAAQNARREIESKQLAGNANSDVALDSLSVSSLRSRLTSLEGQMAEQRTTLGPRHPKVLELSSEIDATRKSLAEEVQSISNNGSVLLERARDLETRYRRALDTERARLLERRPLQDEESKLVLELQSAQATYKKALDGYDQIVFASAGNYTDVSLISRADPPAKPDKPSKKKWFMLACLGSLGFALLWPFGYEMLLNRRLRCRDDLERHFGIPVLAELGPLPALSG